MSSKILSTDVLVIGGGGAGLRAAIEAKKHGAHVTLVSKIKAGYNNSTALSNGLISYCSEELDEEFFNFVVTEGGFLNDQRLVEIFVQDVKWRIPELRRFGVTLQFLGLDKVAKLNPRNPVPLFQVAQTEETRSLGLTQPLRSTAEELGTRILDDVQVTKLLTDDNTVVGATALQVAGGDLLVILAKATVLATGGGEQVYLRPDADVRPDFNKGTTGDGYALAYNAGAELMDMEFVNHHLPAHRRGKISTERYRELVTEATRDLGRNDDRWSFDRISAHYFYGGLRIDAACKTSLDNLYAAGEVASGIFGAGRLGGAALADAFVFGARAGEHAAENAKTVEQISPDESQIYDERSRLRGMREAKSKVVSPDNLRREIKSITWNYAGAAKTQALLEQGVAQLDVIEEQTSRLYANNNAELSEAVEALNMLDVARMLVASALERTESRGVHWRLDYPAPDNTTWLKNIVVTNEKGMTLTTNPVVPTRLSSLKEFRVGVGFWAGYFKIVPAS